MNNKNHSTGQFIDTGDPFCGIPTFLRSRHTSNPENEDFDIGVLGLPFDEGAPYLNGQRFCARAIREQSLRFGGKGYYNFDEKRVMLEREMLENRIIDFGDVPITPTSIDKYLRDATNKVRGILKTGALLVALGGDHSISYPVVNGFDVLDEPINIFHLDSHSDFSEITEDAAYTNGHPFTHIFNMPHVESITQVGIRSLRSFDAARAEAAGCRVVGMKEFRRLGPEGAGKLIEKRKKVYVSIDIDVLDASLIPGCVSAEPNGFTFEELTETLRQVAKNNEIVGFDLVEVAPNLDVATNTTSYLATHIIVEFLGNICDQDWFKKKYIE